MAHCHHGSWLKIFVYVFAFCGIAGHASEGYASMKKKNQGSKVLKKPNAFPLKNKQEVLKKRRLGLLKDHILTLVKESKHIEICKFIHGNDEERQELFLQVLEQNPHLRFPQGLKKTLCSLALMDREDEEEIKRLDEEDLKRLNKTHKKKKKHVQESPRSEVSASEDSDSDNEEIEKEDNGLSGVTDGLDDDNDDCFPYADNTYPFQLQTRITQTQEPIRYNYEQHLCNKPFNSEPNPLESFH